MRIFPLKVLSLVPLAASLLVGCATMQKNPGNAVIAVAAIPVAVAVAVPLELMHIAHETSRPSPRPLNEQPMFGNQPKTAEMMNADAQFLASTEKFGYTRAQGSDKSVQLGWKYFFEKKDIPTAMKRFNQAWLLDPDNGDAFHGFAVLVMARDHDAARADSLFQQGVAKPRQSPGIYLDYGRFLLTVNRPADAIAPLRHAIAVPNMGPDAQALLTLALYQSGDVAAACAESTKVQDGAQPVIRDQARDLKGCET